jgi:hypothetical protein
LNWPSIHQLHFEEGDNLRCVFGPLEEAGAEENRFGFKIAGQPGSAPLLTRVIRVAFEWESPPEAGQIGALVLYAMEVKRQLSTLTSYFRLSPSATVRLWFASAPLRNYSPLCDALGARPSKLRKSLNPEVPLQPK